MSLGVWFILCVGFFGLTHFFLLEYCPFGPAGCLQFCWWHSGGRTSGIYFGSAWSVLDFSPG